MRKEQKKRKERIKAIENARVKNQRGKGDSEQEKYF